MANTRTVSCLAEVDVLQEMGINTIDGAGQVEFILHKQVRLAIQLAWLGSAQLELARYGNELARLGLLLSRAKRASSKSNR